MCSRIAISKQWNFHRKSQSIVELVRLNPDLRYAVPMEATRTALGQFRPGVSGNPGGHPQPATKELARYIRDVTRNGTELVEVVLGILRDETAGHNIRLQAVDWLANRAFGKAPVSIDIHVDGREGTVPWDRVPLHLKIQLLDSLSGPLDDEGAAGEPSGPVLDVPDQDHER